MKYNTTECEPFLGTDRASDQVKASLKTVFSSRIRKILDLGLMLVFKSEKTKWKQKLTFIIKAFVKRVGI